jgi:hypothetical protein
MRKSIYVTVMVFIVAITSVTLLLNPPTAEPGEEVDVGFTGTAQNPNIVSAAIWGRVTVNFPDGTSESSEGVVSIPITPGHGASYHLNTKMTMPDYPSCTWIIFQVAMIVAIDGPVPDYEVSEIAEWSIHILEE